MCFESPNYFIGGGGGGASLKREGGEPGDKSTEGGRARYGKREVLTPMSPPKVFSSTLGNSNEESMKCCKAAQLLPRPKIARSRRKMRMMSM